MSTFERIKNLSDKQGKSLQDIALELGFSINIFYKWKTSSPKAIDLKKVADYFNVSMDYLLGGTDDPTPLSNNEEDPYSKMAMKFRKNEMDIAPEDREEYRKEVETLMDFVKFKMKQLDDEKRKNK
ncbi:MAG: helix-turn-helix domain-containing protein [Vagococcus salmoninarum]|uniref:helix-turn-helix domain-containing protein n=1 Tax=Vagococcus salmoninarum TaxID=2739 RepID=UPI003F95951A